MSLKLSSSCLICPEYRTLMRCSSCCTDYDAVFAVSSSESSSTFSCITREYKPKYSSCFRDRATN